MADNFPFFKFFATEWLTGNIVFEDMKLQGLFINICALYWQRNGVVIMSDLHRRYPQYIKEIEELAINYLNVNENRISIQFLDEQLIEANHISIKRKQAGSKGGQKSAIAKQMLEVAEANVEQNQPNKNKKKNKKEEKEKEKDIPTLEEFLDYVELKSGNEYPAIKVSAKYKYQAWLENGWCTGNGGKIKNWKSTILNTISFLKKDMHELSKVKPVPVAEKPKPSNFWTQKEYEEACIALGFTPDKY
jgi:hypothetical protein